MKRLFIAADVDERTRDAIGRISANLRERMNVGGRVSWVRPDRMHLTLYFNGRADDRMEGHFLAALAKPFTEPPFDLSFSGLGFFPAHGSPRVLWLAIRDGLAELQRVQQIVAGRIPGRAHQPFSPHLTLARFRLPGRTRGQLKEIAAIVASAGPCRIDRVTLYESRLSPAGPMYLRLAQSALTGPGSTQ